MLKGLTGIKPISVDTGILILRACFGLMLMRFGLEKFLNFAVWSKDFTDPLGVGSSTSLALTIFGELICSAFLVLGLFTRAVLIPLIFMMLVMIFLVHGDDPFSKKEHAISFLVPFIVIFLSGPGKYSADRLIFKDRAIR
jgi:putative oxidoreductase